AGDGVGRADLGSVVQLCQQYPDNRFLVTLLSRENQHELCVTARKFANLLPFGCWWFMNNPSLIEEITRERIEMLGWSFVPQHSDARVLDQLLYKWPHSRRIIAKVLIDKYADLLQTGWKVTEDEIRRDVSRLFYDNFETFVP
ncbi:MAG TPA: glucuronate isomerase, partial [bacterium]|nr:glucuronate isomerase [bacterium]